MTSLYDNIIFGPIRSRRLGLSLGVNLLPVESKLCSFDCIYCECGWNADHPGKRRFNAREDVYKMLDETLAKMVGEGTPPDVITFAGNGEPTMHPDFEAIIEDTIALRDKHCPNAKVSVLSYDGAIWYVGMPENRVFVHRVRSPLCFSRYSFISTPDPTAPVWS